MEEISTLGGRLLTEPTPTPSPGAPSRSARASSATTTGSVHASSGTRTTAAGDPSGRFSPQLDDATIDQSPCVRRRLTDEATSVSDSYCEYDRGTERARQYDAKLAAYSAYRNSGQAAHHYAGLAHVLFVTSSEAAEERIVAAIEHALARYGDRGFAFLTTTETRIEELGILGVI